MSSLSPDVKGPFILWQNYGTEGWHSTSFDILDNALKCQKYCTEWIITRPVKFKVVDENGN